MAPNNPASPKKVGVVAVVTLTASLMTGDMTAEPYEENPDKTISYTVDMTQIRDDFNQTGTVRLLVPDLGELVVAGSPAIVREGNQWSEVLPDGQTVYHVDYSIPLTGTVVGVPGSTATLLLGDYGVYGRVTVPGADFEFDPLYRVDTSSFTQLASVTL